MHHDTTTTTGVGELQSCLEDFRPRFNGNARVQKLIKNWERHVVVEATDTGAVHTMVIANNEMLAVEPGPPAADDDTVVCLQASSDTMVEIFSGRMNPSIALLDGMLSVYSMESDKVKLEALAMVVWGM